MAVLLRNLVFTFVFCLVYLLENSLQINKQIVSLSIERPCLLYENLKYVHVINYTSLRRGRRDPVHYFQICMQYFIPLDQNSQIIINIYEFLSNEYRPSFVMAKFNLCEFLGAIDLDVAYAKNISEPFKILNTHRDVVKSSKKTCLFDPGVYCLQNWTWPLRTVPQNFPFEKGRLFMNQTYKNELVGGGYIDLELKTVPLRKHKA